MKLDSQKMISGEKRISRPRTSQSARSRIKGPIYQEEDPSNFWEVDLSFRPIDISIFGMFRYDVVECLKKRVPKSLIV